MKEDFLKNWQTASYCEEIFCNTWNNIGVSHPSFLDLCELAHAHLLSLAYFSSSHSLCSQSSDLLANSETPQAYSYLKLLQGQLHFNIQVKTFTYPVRVSMTTICETLPPPPSIIMHLQCLVISELILFVPLFDDWIVFLSSQHWKLKLHERRSFDLFMFEFPMLVT